MKNLRFDRQFFRDLWTLFKPYWVSEEKGVAFLLLFLVILCTIIQVRTNVALNTFYKDFFNAIQNFDKSALFHLILRLVIIAAFLILAVGYNVYFSGLLTIRWRRWLTQKYQNSWLDKHVFYKMQILNRNVDNPDQRISEDLDSFPSATLGLFTSIFTSLLTLFSFGYILWTLSGSLQIPLGKTQIISIPGYLLWAAFLYAVLGTWLTAFIGKRLGTLNYQQQYFNADFRFGLVRVREASEQIALYRGETVENSKFQGLFKRIYDNYINIIKVQKRLMFFQFGYNTLSYIFGLTISMPLYFAKKIQIGGIMQISGAFGEVIGALSLFISLFAALANWRAVIFRLAEFSGSIKTALGLAANIPIDIKKHSDRNLIVNNLNLLLPDGTPLLQNINLTIHPGDTILLVGPSGVGKSTLLRALAGIWPYGHGQIILPQNAKMMFLPQKPYLPLGSLHDVLTYPYQNHNFSNEKLKEVLSICNLNKLQTELETIRHWSHELSLGEQQLIGFARILLQKPDWVFLDEATSAMDENTEGKIYQTIRDYLPETTIISIGHRGSLANYHQKKIEIMKDIYGVATTSIPAVAFA